MDWKECCNKRIAKEINIDNELINSLIKSSKNKELSEDKLIMDKITASSKISLVYDSLRELLEAIAIKNKYKIYNHECYTPFLKEILKMNSQAEEFDEIRKIRNNINYYGKDVSIEEAELIINKIKNLKKSMRKLL
ncbi:hypothetical protein J4230_00715 [Candidatus Woesearchaeota archaeon]|nr:hypothetical protein [Candidatus Woesearchaeota archaeon]